MDKQKNILFYFILIFSWSTFYFYSPVGISITMLKAFYWILMLIVLGLSLKHFVFITPKGSLYYNLFKAILIGVFITLLTSYFSWNQSISLTFRASFPYYIFGLYFFFWRFKPDKNKLEKIIWILCITYLLCYFYALTKAPAVVFGNSEKLIDDQRGFLRLFIPGRSFLYLAYFMALARYNKLKTNYWLVIMLSLFVIICMHVIRQYILFAFIIGFYVVFKELNWLKKIIVVTIVLFSVSYLYEQSPVLQNLVEMSEGQLKENSGRNEDIRITSLRYFFTEFSPNVLSKIFGNGVPHLDSSYGSFYANRLNNKGMYMSDVGYAQIYALFGGLGLFLFLRLFYKGLRQKRVSIDYKYAQWYIGFVVLSNISSGFVLNTSTLVTLVFVYYILEIHYIERINSLKYERI